ncbi:MAG: metallophosphoesterase family protein [Candidatus Micrarchaeia archaeon]
MALRIFFAADLHGSEMAMNKLINSAQFYKLKYIVVGGDLTGKVLVPIVREGNRYSLELFGEQKRIKESELKDIESEIRLNGEYYRVMERDEYEEAQEDPKLIRKIFIEEMLKSLETFIQKAHSRLEPIGAKMLLLAGNDDYEEVADYIKRNSDGTAIEFDKKAVGIEGYNFIGYGYSNRTPWNTPRERDEETIYKELNSAVSGVDPGKSVYVIHVPPINTKIDKAPELTSDLKQRISSGYMSMRSVGSEAVRRVIEERAPIAGLHGHIHEATGIDYIKSNSGKLVPVFNPGSDYSSGVLSGVIIDFDDYKVVKYNFTRG